MFKTLLSILTLAAFSVSSIIGPIARADDFRLPAPGVMVRLSPPLEPPILKGIKVHPENPFRFDFILDKGDSRLGNDQLKGESSKLIKYFLTSLTIPEKDLWVNLSPYEKDRIIPQSFGLTEMGRDLLAEDYMLKQITASLIYPEDEFGKKFWKRVYAEASQKYGTTNIPVNTFNKVWILPAKAVVYENVKAGTAYVVESSLKVMLEQDYLSLEKNQRQPGLRAKATQRNSLNALGSQIIREIVIPELAKEVNEDKNFSQLRQVYNSLILATWYKKKIKDSILTQVYADKNKVAGVNISNPREKELIYQRYLQAFKKGVYSYIKEEQDPMTQETIPRKYFSGGFTAMRMDEAMVTLETMPDQAMLDSRPERDVIIGAQLNNAENEKEPADHAMLNSRPIIHDMEDGDIASYFKAFRGMAAAFDHFVPVHHYYKQEDGSERWDNLKIPQVLQLLGKEFVPAVTRSSFYGLDVDQNVLFNNLVRNGYISENGVVQEKFKEMRTYSDMKVGLVLEPSVRRNIFKILQHPTSESVADIKGVEKLIEAKVTVSGENTRFQFFWKQGKRNEWASGQDVPLKESSVVPARGITKISFISGVSIERGKFQYDINIDARQRLNIKILKNSGPTQEPVALPASLAKLRFKKDHNVPDDEGNIIFSFNVTPKEDGEYALVFMDHTVRNPGSALAWQSRETQSHFIYGGEYQATGVPSGINKKDLELVNVSNGTMALIAGNEGLTRAAIETASKSIRKNILDLDFHNFKNIRDVRRFVEQNSLLVEKDTDPYPSLKVTLVVVWQDPRGHGWLIGINIGDNRLNLIMKSGDIRLLSAGRAQKTKEGGLKKHILAEVVHPGDMVIATSGIGVLHEFLNARSLVNAQKQNGKASFVSVATLSIFPGKEQDNASDLAMTAAPVTLFQHEQNLLKREMTSYLDQLPLVKWQDRLAASHRLFSFYKLRPQAWNAVMIGNFIAPLGVEEAARNIPKELDKSTQGDPPFQISRRNARMASIYALGNGALSGNKKGTTAEINKEIASRVEREAQLWMQWNHLNEQDQEVKTGTKHEIDLIKQFKLGHNDSEIPQEFSFLENIRLILITKRMSIQIHGMNFWVYNSINRLIPLQMLSPQAAQIIFPGSGTATTADGALKGGIDFNANRMNLQLQNNGGEIKFHIDPALLRQLQDSPGFVPVITTMQPLNSLRQFLGIEETSAIGA